MGVFSLATDTYVYDEALSYYLFGFSVMFRYFRGPLFHDWVLVSFSYRCYGLARAIRELVLDPVKVLVCQALLMFVWRYRAVPYA